MQARFNESDVTYMAEAIHLARQGLYTTSPNPRVGCVIVKDGNVVGRGAHLRAGEPHAEVFALQEAGFNAKAATAYVTLEPCSHTGRTPPCANALIEAGISRVVIAMQDPNPLVSGKGIQRLLSSGILVDIGLLEQQAKQLNLGFIKRMTSGMPHVRLKSAASLDGQTALKNGESQWITSEHARADVQSWRAQSCAILTGIGTVLADDPLMNVRLESTTRQPIKVILDSTMRISKESRILNDGPVIIIYSELAYQSLTSTKQQELITKRDHLQARGIQTLSMSGNTSKLDLEMILKYLASQGVNEVFVEAGATLAGALLAKQYVDELILYMAPKLMGVGRGLFDFSIPTMTASIPLQIQDLRQIGPDIRIIAKPMLKV